MPPWHDAQLLLGQCADAPIRLIQSRLKDGRRAHRLVVEDDAPLRCALDTATGGAELAEIVHAVAAKADADRDDARDYVSALIETKVLTPVAEPAVTGPEPPTRVLSSLTSPGFAATARALRRVADELARLDARGVGNPPEAHDACGAYRSSVVNSVAILSGVVLDKRS